MTTSFSRSSQKWIRRSFASHSGSDWGSHLSKLQANLTRVVGDKSSLTLAEKILFSHSHEPIRNLVRGSSYIKLNPDRVAMQDASAQTAMLQFMLCGKSSTAVPSSIHCDHLIAAEQGADSDLTSSLITNKEIFDFLESASRKFGISFWKPGSGIIHQIVLENYAAPGMLLLGTDSHTPNAGGLGTIAIGVGGADAVDAMAGVPWELKAPKILGVRLTGKLSGWTAPKDVILRLAGLLSVQGGTHHIIEYFGPGVESLSCTGQATICNMGAELGATTSVFPFTPAMSRYLNATGRSHVAQAAEKAHAQGFLKADKNAEYDKVVEIDLSTLEPYINGPFSPDVSWPLSKFASVVKEKRWPQTLSAALIGSCTNSSYEDMSKAASIAQQAKAAGIQVQSQFLVTPGSEQIRATMERDGYTNTLQDAGATVLANACGPCIGQWKRLPSESKESNVILTSFNRNFAGRNDGSRKTMNFLASPEIVTAMAFAGTTTFNPATDSLHIPGNGGKTSFKFIPPSSDELPSTFDQGRSEYSQPIETQDTSVQINIDPKSTRLQELQPFGPWNGKEFSSLPVLVKVQGKCTTDHISAAGPWLKYKGHLENISKNTLMTAMNAFTGSVNEVLNPFTGKVDTIPNVAFDYQKQAKSWIVVADENYGEGSAREHAAMQPRFLGCKMIVCRSFARIHETNLKKQGVLPVTFTNPADYDKIQPDAHVSTEGLVSLAPGSALTLVVKQTNSSGAKETITIPVVHTMSADQIEWFKAGSALNLIAAAAN